MIVTKSYELKRDSLLDSLKIEYTYFIELPKKERRQLNRHYINLFKTIMGCAKCGYDKHPSALDIDHLDPSTKYTTSGGIREHFSDLVWRYTFNTLIDELKKCRVLCSNCHMEYTHLEQRIKPEF